MAYTPKTWQCNDTITADELNRMEQGIAEASQGGGGVAPLFAHLTYDRDDQIVRADVEELNDLRVTLANHDKPLWVQLKSKETREGETFEPIMWVAPAAYTVDFDDLFTISASYIGEGLMEAINIWWDGSNIGGGYSTYQLQATQ